MKKRNLFQKSKHQRGQSLVELAISLTVILMLLSGAVDFGMAFFSYTAMRDAAQEGALYGSFQPLVTDSQGNTYFNAQGITSRIQQASNFHYLGPVTITVTPTNGINYACQGIGPNGTTNGIQVMIHYNYPLVMPFLGAFIGSQTIPLTATVTDTILSPQC